MVAMGNSYGRGVDALRAAAADDPSTTGPMGLGRGLQGA